jgi:hypothetical protein
MEGGKRMEGDRQGGGQTGSGDRQGGEGKTERGDTGRGDRQGGGTDRKREQTQWGLWHSLPFVGAVSVCGHLLSMHAHCSWEGGPLFVGGWPLFMGEGGGHCHPCELEGGGRGGHLLSTCAHHSWEGGLSFVGGGPLFMRGGVVIICVSTHGSMVVMVGIRLWLCGGMVVVVIL